MIVLPRLARHSVAELLKNHLSNEIGLFAVEGVVRSGASLPG